MADTSSGLGAALAGLLRNEGGIARGAEARPAPRGGAFGRALPPLGLTNSRSVRTPCRPPGAETSTGARLESSRAERSVEWSAVSRLEASLERIDPLLGRLFARLWEAGDPRLVLTAGALTLASLRCTALGPQDFRLLRAAVLQGLIIWHEDEAGRDGGPSWESAILALDCALAEWMTELALLDGALPERLARSWARQRAARLDHDKSRHGTVAAAATGGALAAKRRHEYDLEAPGWEIAECLLGSGAAAGRMVSSAEVVRAGAWLGMLARLAVTARLGGSPS